MFGVTTPCVQAVTKRLEADYDCLVFHATGIGGRAMESARRFRPARGLPRPHHHRGRRHAGRRRLRRPTATGSAPPIRTGMPYVGSAGALDMVNFGPRDTVPEKFRSRKFVIHNPNVTLMRTTRDENRAIGEWIGARLNAMDGPVRFLLPEGRRVRCSTRPGAAVS